MAGDEEKEEEIEVHDEVLLTIRKRAISACIMPRTAFVPPREHMQAASTGEPKREHTTRSRAVGWDDTGDGGPLVLRACLRRWVRPYSFIVR